MDDYIQTKQEDVKSKHFLAFMPGYYDGKKLWASCETHNGLYRIHLNQGTIEYVGRFQQEKLNAQYIGSYVIRYQDELFFGAAHKMTQYKLISYNILTGEQHQYIREQEETEGIFLYGDKVYVIPRAVMAPAFVFDIKSRTYEERWLNIATSKGDRLAFWRYISEGRNLYLQIRQTNILYKMDAETWKTEKMVIGDSDNKIDYLFQGEHCFWCIDRERNVLTKWENGIGKEIKISVELCDMCRGIEVNGKVYLFPQQKQYQQIAVYEEETNQVYEIKLPECVRRIATNEFLYGAIMCIDNTIVALPGAISHIIKINPYGGDEVSCIECSIDEKADSYYEVLAVKEILAENRDGDLGTFLRYVNLR